MCISCDWAKHRNLFHTDETTLEEKGLSRRQFFQAGAAFAALGLAPALSATSAFAQSAVDGKADIVFRNGAVYTVNDAQPWVQAVAVQGKRIVYVGDDAGVESFIGPATRLVDLGGKMLLPGFVDGHIHPILGATITRGIDLQFDGRDEVLNTLKAYSAKIGKADIVRGFGWRYNTFPASGPHRADLDRIWADIPVFLIAVDGHAAWVNSKALELAKVTKETKDPLPGFSYFQRDPATGEPTGYLVEPPALLQILNAIAPFTRDYIAQSLEEWLPKASAVGITSVYDAGAAILPEDSAFRLYTDLEQQGKLPFRVVGSLYHNNPAIDPVPKSVALRKQFRSELVQAPVLKLFADGGDPQYTAALLEPYSDRPDTSGDMAMPVELFKDIIRRADHEGLDIHVHSFGDRATRVTLDAFEAAIRTNPARERRHAMAHLFTVAKEDQPRFAKLGVVGQFSAQWSVPDQYWINVASSRYGPARARKFQPINSLLRQGATVSFGTDWPAGSYYSTFRPLEAIEIAVTRQELNKPKQAPLPGADERVSLADALRASTMGPAYQLRLEKQVGSIEVGKFADLVVLEKNLFDIPVHEIHKTKVLMTVMNGQVRHEQALS